MSEKSTTSEMQASENKKMKGCLKASAIVISVALLTVGGCFIMGGAAIVGSAKKQAEEDSQKIQALESATASELQPIGELANIFNLNSDHTDIQRENKEKEIKGKIVEWVLSVYEIKKTGDSYLIQTKTNIGGYGNEVAAFVEITARNPHERSLVESLTTGARFRFKGYVDGVRMRSLNIKPAILIHADSESASHSGKIGENIEASKILKEGVMIEKTAEDVLLEDVIRAANSVSEPIAFDVIEREALATATPSDLSPHDSELHDRNWDWKSIAGKIIEWTLTVKDVQRVPDSQDRYVLRTGRDFEVSCYVELIADDDQSRKFILGINPGSVFTIRGQLADYQANEFIVMPAIIVGDHLGSHTVNKLDALAKTSGEFLDFASLVKDVSPNFSGTSLQQEEIRGRLMTLKGEVVSGIFSNSGITSGQRVDLYSSGFVLGQYNREVNFQIFMPFVNNEVMEEITALIKSDKPIPFRGYLSEIKEGVIRINPAVMHAAANASGDEKKGQDPGTSSESKDQTPPDDAGAMPLPVSDPLVNSETRGLDLDKKESEGENLGVQSKSNSNGDAEVKKFNSDEVFVTSITINDIKNTRGGEISDPVLILMQDRANVHRFGNPDGDAVDQFFKEAERRARIRSYLNRGSFPQDVRKSIARGSGVKFKVRIYKNAEGKECVDVSFYNEEQKIDSVMRDSSGRSDSEADGRSLDMYELIDSESNIREGPGIDSPIIRKSRRGEVGEHLSVKMGWMALKFADGSVGWVHERSVKPQSK